MSAISIQNAKKNYGAVQALKGIDLEIRNGEFFGLLGPNGAGKTTLIGSIVGLTKLSEGTISVLGHDVRKDYLRARSAIGFAPQDINLDRFFPIRHILAYHAGFYGIPRSKRFLMADEMLEKFGLSEKAKLSYYRLSGGMQKRLLIAKAMLTRPQVLILDEPTAGVDVEQRHTLWGMLRELNKNGTTIILTTHYIDEAEALCERIGIINLGEIRELGSPQELIGKYCKKKLILKTGDKTETIETENPLETLDKIRAERGSNSITDFHVERGTLEDVFLKVTGMRMTP